MTTHPLQLLVRHLDNRVPLASDDRQAILALPYWVRNLRASEKLLQAGEASQSCAVILKGFGGRSRETERGRQILSVHLPGEPINLPDFVLGSADCPVEMITAGMVATIPSAAFSTLATARPAIARACFASVAAEASISREWLVNNGSRDAAHGLAHLLCELVFRLEKHQLADQYPGLPIRHKQLAQILALTPIHVGRIMKQLVEDGLVVGRKPPIAVSDRARLQRLCGFDPAYLHFK